MDDQPPPIAPQPPAGAARPAMSGPDVQPARPLPLRQMGIGEIIDTAIQLYRSQWLVLIGVVAFVLVPLYFLQGYLTRVFSSPALQTGRVSQADVNVAFAATIVLVLVQFLIVQPFLVAAIARAATNVYLGEPVSIGSIYRFALTRVLSILWISILSGLAILLGFILLIIPGILVWVRLAFATTVLVVEGEGGTKAIGRSWRLAAGHFWRLLGAFILAGLIAFIGSAVLTIPIGIVALALGPNGWALNALGNSLVTVLVTPFSTLITVLLYFDLRIRKEGYDIAVMTQELAQRR
jgi:hypothetical protein